MPRFQRFLRGPMHPLLEYLDFEKMCTKPNIVCVNKLFVVPVSTALLHTIVKTWSAIEILLLCITLKRKVSIYIFQSRGDEPICYRGPLCQLPLSKRAAQLFSHTMKPVKNEKNCSSTEANNKRK